MQRIIASLLICGVLLQATPIRADTSPENMFVEEDSSTNEGYPVSPQLQQEAATPPQIEMVSEPQGEQISSPVDQGNYTDQESFVSPSTVNEQEKKAQRKRWQNIFLAVGAVVVAVAAMLIVDQNEGHSKHSKSRVNVDGGASALQGNGGDRLQIAPALFSNREGTP